MLVLLLIVLLLLVAGGGYVTLHSLAWVLVVVLLVALVWGAAARGRGPRDPLP